MEVKSAIAKEIKKYALPDEKQKMVIEIGAGDGKLGELLGRLNPLSIITSIDLRGNFVTEQNNHQVVLANCENLPFKNSLFEVVVAVRSLHFIENLEKGLGEIDRILKPGGIFLAIYYPVFQFEDELAGEIFNKFGSNLLEAEMKEYWSSETAKNFLTYCDPENEARKKLYGNDEQITFDHTEKIDLLDLEKVLVESEIVKKFIARNGKLHFDQKFEVLQQDLLELEGFDFSDLLFVNCTFSITFQISLLLSKKPNNVLEEDLN